MTETTLAYGTRRGIDPTAYPAAFGARLIYAEVIAGGTGIVHDRVHFIGDREDIDKLIRVLNGGKMKIAMEKFQKLHRFGTVASGTDETETLLDDDELRVVANPQKSYGYLYLTAVLK